MPLQIRRGLQAERDDLVTSYVPLAAGEPLFTTDEGQLYIGDGSTPGGILVNPEPSPDLSEYVGQIGEIEKDPLGQPGIKSPFITLNGQTASIDLEKQITSNVTPNTNELFDLGETDFRFRRIFVGGDGLAIGEATLSAQNGPFIDLPENSTVGGVPIPTGAGVETGASYTINIVGEDSTVIVNSVDSSITATGGITGDLTGDVTGSIFSSDDTLMIDADNSTLGNGILTLENGNIFTSTERVFIGDETDANNNLEVYGRTIVLNSVTEGTTETSGTILARSVKGTLTTPVALANDDIHAGFSGAIWNGADYQTNFAILGQVDTQTGSETLPGKLVLAARGYDSIFKTVTLDSRGTFEATTLKVAPYASTAARDSGIPTPEAGMVVFVSDDGSQGGSPAVPKLQVYDGAAWVSLN